MANKTRWNKAFLAGLILVITFTGWLVFAPPQLGGQATMIIVNGNSMEPVYHSGDLVIVHSKEVYQVGDIIAYKNLHMGRYVIHRIVDEEMNRFILKGDNNSWNDSFEPTSNEIIGKHWLRIPVFGKIISWLRTPIYLSLSASLLGGFLR